MNYRVKRQAGLTLVELMVATTLSLVLSGRGAAGVFGQQDDVPDAERARHSAGEWSLCDAPDHRRSADGWFRRLPVTAYRSTHRGVV